jgi:glutaryl-CoA dehydrogenase
LSDPSDLLGLDDLLAPDELALRSTVRAFVDSEIKPNIADWFERA